MKSLYDVRENKKDGLKLGTFRNTSYLCSIKLLIAKILDYGKQKQSSEK